MTDRIATTRYLFIVTQEGRTPEGIEGYTRAEGRARAMERASRWYSATGETARATYRGEVTRHEPRERMAYLAQGTGLVADWCREQLAEVSP